jgi:PKD repeat protein
MKLVKSAIKIIIGFAIIFIINSCEAPEPYAAFEPNNYSARVNSEIYFYNNSRDADSYLWDFGDGKTSIEEAPSHLYSDTGNYTISLTTFNKNKTKSDKYEIELKIKSREILLYAIEFLSIPSNHFDGSLVDDYPNLKFNIYLNNDTVYKYPIVQYNVSLPKSIYLLDEYSINSDLVLDQFDETYTLELFSFASPSTYKSIDTLNFSFNSDNLNYSDFIYFNSKRGTYIALKSRGY